MASRLGVPLVVAACGSDAMPSGELPPEPDHLVASSIVAAVGVLLVIWPTVWRAWRRWRERHHR